MGERRIAAPDASGEWISLAVVVKTQGRRGEVAVELHTDVPDRFRQDMRLWALGRDGQRREVKVEDLWPHKSFLVLKFEGVETISDAEPLLGAELQLPRSERAELEPGWTYLSDLIGCTVFDGQREIGEIEDVHFGAGEAPLLVVRGKEQRSKLPYEIPFAEAYLEKLDLERKQVRMKLPEGLLEVNAPVKKGAHMWKRDMSPEEAAQVIERFLNGPRRDSIEWCDFAETGQQDARIERYRKRCDELSDLVNCPGEMDEAAVEELRSIIKQLRSLD
ncbi:MAG: ribosome maturation factor RimM [Terriglobales bacterium]